MPNKIACTSAVAIALLLSGTIASYAQVKLRIVNNGGALGKTESEAFYKPFSKEAGIEIVEDNYNQELAKIRSQIDTKNLQWDVVSVTAINEATGCEEGLFEQIDWSKYIDVKLLAGAGGATKCGIPYFLVSGALAYDAAKIKDPPKTWKDFWDVKRWPGKRGMLYRAEQTLEIALMADGVEPPKVMQVLSAPGGVDRAFKKLEELKPSIHWWKAGAESMQLLAAGEVSMIYAWNGRVAAANTADKRDFKMSFEAGHVSGGQYYVVMKGSPRLKESIDFIKFAVSPAPQAAMSKLISYGPTNSQALGLLSDADKATLPPADPSRVSLQGGKVYLDFWVQNGDALLQRFVKFAAQ
jgi:putative spermidine/putrescine transport system substrate-binding protein